MIPKELPDTYFGSYLGSLFETCPQVYASQNNGGWWRSFGLGAAYTLSGLQSGFYPSALQQIKLVQ